MSKWLCKKCNAINPDLGFQCHNCKHVNTYSDIATNNTTTKEMLESTLDGLETGKLSVEEAKESILKALINDKEKLYDLIEESKPKGKLDV